MNNRFQKYLAYASGEILLVIAGILIALQIDAWYENEQINDELDAQLAAVAAGISQDLARIEQLKRYRVDAMFKLDRWAQTIGFDHDADQWFNQRFVSVGSELISESQRTEYFVASDSAYDNLRSSGLINQLGEDSLKRQLHEYYETVERITFTEREMNSLIRDAAFQFQTVAIRGLSRLLIAEPLIMWSDSAPEFSSAETKVLYRSMLLDPITATLFSAGVNQPLLAEYQHLLTLGGSDQ